MDDKTISLDAKQILAKSFAPHGNGYDPDEVDAYLDRIIRDYQAFERYHQESREYTVSLETQLRQAKERIAALEVENAGYKSRLLGIKDSDKVDSTNIDLISRITKLENELYRHGVNPSQIK